MLEFVSTVEGSHLHSIWRNRGIALHLAAATLALTMEALTWGGLPVHAPLTGAMVGIFCLVVGHQVLTKGGKALLARRFSSINLLVTISVVGAFVLGEYSEAAVVIALFALGEKLESYGVSTSKAALKALAERTPQQAEVRGRGLLPLAEVGIGDVIIVKAGGAVGLDGTVESGSGLADESSLTGEPLPRAKSPGDDVFSGTQLTNGYLEIKVRKAAQDSTLARIIEMTAKATGEKASFQRFIERFARIYTPTVLAGATLVFLVPVLFFHQSWQHWFEQALTLLVISCPCALVISTPISVFAAVGNAASRGVLIKGGRYLEILAQVNTVVMDKTRTITVGKPVVTDVITLGPMSADAVLECAAGIEKLSEHPLAQSIVERAVTQGLRPHAAGNYETILGKGARAECYVCQDREHFIGSRSLAVEKLELLPATEQKLAELARQGKTAVLLWNEKSVEGLIGLQDVVKPEARASIQALQRQGITTVMLTGDAVEPAQAIARDVGITEVHAGLLPDEKAHRIQALTRAGRIVAMIGDGVNDAPALASASVGIAMGAAGSDVAIETAHVALMNDRLHLVPFLVSLGKRTWGTIRFNAILAVIVKVAVLVLASTGHSSLTLAILSDVGLLIFVVFFSLHLLRWAPPMRL
jgi:Cd2+/Zn2+-exporting ATPase